MKLCAGSTYAPFAMEWTNSAGSAKAAGTLTFIADSGGGLHTVLRSASAMIPESRPICQTLKMHVR